MEELILTKTTTDGDYKFDLRKVGNEYIIYKLYTRGGANLADVVGQFKDEEKAKSFFFEKINY